ncbi:YtzI protein [Aciduricibacillus chroicocephali]|uniref:YtzI protein n=1 Tax=Aciduricibacillus chroicocephali TaxID=3054939 RepID=A0ABY9KW88_9BACI|nr:YtzI protein [Bacillaceae bacterium 44XB]
MLVASIVSVVLTLLVLVLSFVTIQKGYAFKHTVDPLETARKKREENT